MQLLHRRPDQRRLLARQPELIPDAVDEFLRLTSPVQGLARTVTRDVTIGDTTIPADRKVLLLYGSGNRDERQYGPDAAELDVTRRPRNILTFSHGAHHCLGAAAARMQSRVALEELLTRIPEFTVDEDDIVWAGGSYVRRPLSVPFTVGGGGLERSDPGGYRSEMADWLAERRTEVAAERILDAADELFTRRDAATVGMNDIATAAGCSRATLYRYFENRDVLYTAYVHRETHRVFGAIGEQLVGLTDPDERLIAGDARRRATRPRHSRPGVLVRQHPPPPHRRRYGRAIRGDRALAQGFLATLGDTTGVEARARWVIRILVSLLLFPGRDAEEERTMLESFVVPVVRPEQPVRQPSRRAP